MPVASTRDYEVFFNHLPEAAWIVDVHNGSIISVNDSAERIYGYSKREFEGLKLSQIDPIEEEADVKKRMQIIIGKGHATFETQHRTKSGKILDVIVSVNLIYLDGYPYLSAICQDITEVKEQKKQFQAIFDNIEEGMLIEDVENSKYIAANPHACRLLGYTKEELLQLKPLDLIPPDFLDAYIIEKPNILTGKTSFLKEKALMRKDRSIFFADIDVSNLYHIEGKAYIAILIRDVTESRQNRLALQISQQKFQTLFDQMPEAAWVVDAHTTRFLDCNRANEDQYGYSKEEFLRLSISDIDFFDDHHDVMDRAKQMLEKGKMVFETKHCTKAGGILDVVVSAQLLVLEEGAIIVITNHDITDNIRREEELRTLNEHLEQRVKEEVEKYKQQQDLLIQQSKFAAKGELIKNIAHQWRQPLHVVAASVQGLKMYAELGQLTSDEIENTVSRTMEQVNHLSQIIDKFGNFFNYEEAPSPFPLKDQIHESLALLKSRFMESDITLSVTGEDFVITGYPTEFRQVLVSILTNAIEAIQARKDVCPDPFHGEISLIVTNWNGRKKLIIQDNGRGIDSTITEQIFDPYFTTKFQGRDIGMSLYMAKLIIEKNFAGSLLLEHSRVGKTVFMIEMQ